jgi:hypothetical protein
MHGYSTLKFRGSGEKLRGSGKYLKIVVKSGEIVGGKKHHNLKWCCPLGLGVPYVSALRDLVKLMKSQNSFLALLQTIKGYLI